MTDDTDKPQVIEPAEQVIAPASPHMLAEPAPPMLADAAPPPQIVPLSIERVDQMSRIERAFAARSLLVPQRRWSR